MFRHVPECSMFLVLSTALFEENKLWTLPYERRPVRANSESASVKAKGSKMERQVFVNSSMRVLISKSRVFSSVFHILNFRRTISRYFQDVLFYSN